MIELLQEAGVWDSVKEASSQAVPYRGSALEQSEARGLVSASDWAAALVASHPGHAQRGEVILNLAQELDADILDLVFKKVGDARLALRLYLSYLFPSLASVVVRAPELIGRIHARL